MLFDSILLKGELEDWELISQTLLLFHHLKLVRESQSFIDV